VMRMVVVSTAAALVMMFMVVMSTAAALVMMFMVVMSTAAALVMMFMVVMSTAAALMMMRMVVVSTAAALMMMFVMDFVMSVTLPVAGEDLHFAFHGAGNGSQLFYQSIGIFGGDAQLFGGKGDGSSLHFRQGIKLVFNSGGAIGTVQIFNDVHFLLHRASSLKATYEQTFM